MKYNIYRRRPGKGLESVSLNLDLAAAQKLQAQLVKRGYEALIISHNSDPWRRR